jgi:hypothetical protein
MDPSKVAENGLSMAAPGEYRFVTGEKPHVNHSQGTVTITNATMEGLENFVLSRKDYIKQRLGETHMRLDTRKSEVTLFVGEAGARKLAIDLDVTPQYIIKASSKLSGDFNEVMEAMDPDGHESPRELAEFFRLRPYLFPDVNECIRVVKELKNTQVRIMRIKKDTESDGGEREKQLKTNIEDGQINIAWNFEVPIFEGLAKTTIPVLARFEVNEDLSDVNVVVLDASGVGVRTMRRETERQQMIDCIQSVENILGQHSIPMVYVDGKE